MDAVKFLQERKRMYESGAIAPSVMLGNNYDPASAVKVVEEWAAAHPVKTRQSVFLEQYPKAIVGDDGVLRVCPSPIFPSARNADNGCVRPNSTCSECRREFWMQEVE